MMNHFHKVILKKAFEYVYIFNLLDFIRTITVNNFIYEKILSLSFIYLNFFLNNSKF